MLRVLGVGRNASRYAESWFGCLLGQTYKDFQAYVILDSPTDDSARMVYLAAKHSEVNTTIQVNTERKHQPRNFYEGVHRMCTSDEDICVIFDLDDALTQNALEVVAQTYKENPECLLTFGTFIREGRNKFDQMEFQCDAPTEGNFRQHPWFASHLKTFKYKLFKQILEADFKYDDGTTWFVRSGDQVIMYPMLEMAGLDRIVRIKQPTYLLSASAHTYDTPYPSVANGKHVHEIVRERQPYQRLP